MFGNILSKTNAERYALTATSVAWTLFRTKHSNYLRRGRLDHLAGLSTPSTWLPIKQHCWNAEISQWVVLSITSTCRLVSTFIILHRLEYELTSHPLIKMTITYSCSDSDYKHERKLNVVACSNGVVWYMRLPFLILILTMVFMTKTWATSHLAISFGHRARLNKLKPDIMVFNKISSVQ